MWCDLRSCVTFAPILHRTDEHSSTNTTYIYTQRMRDLKRDHHRHQKKEHEECEDENTVCVYRLSCLCCALYEIQVIIVIMVDKVSLRVCGVCIARGSLWFLCLRVNVNDSVLHLYVNIYNTCKLIRIVFDVNAILLKTIIDLVPFVAVELKHDQKQ